MQCRGEREDAGRSKTRETWAPVLLLVLDHPNRPLIPASRSIADCFHQEHDIARVLCRDLTLRAVLEKQPVGCTIWTIFPTQGLLGRLATVRT